MNTETGRKMAEGRHEFMDTADEVIKIIRPLVERLERDFRNLSQQYDLDTKDSSNTTNY